MTAPYEPHLVAPQKTGQDLSLDPWLIPQDAYESILDAYQYLGDIYKRDGSVWFDAVPHAIDGGAGHHYVNISAITTTISAQVTTYAAHGRTTGDWVRITGATGISGGPSPINGTRWIVTVTGADTLTLNNASAFSGAYTGNGTLSFFPAQHSATYLPVVCIATYAERDNTKTLLVLDTRRASFYDPTIQALTPIGYQDQFTGSAENLFWWENYIPSNGGAATIYFTNNLDNIFYWNGTQQATGLTDFTPLFDSGNGYVVTKCLMIKGVSSRLVLFNTTEQTAAGDITFPTRVRWCSQGSDPTSAASPGPWEDVIPGPNTGNDFDLTDSQYLITLGQIQGNIILASQVNTLGQPYAAIYQMYPSSDPVNAFVFNKIAQSRNVLSTFGTISLDREITFVGDNGLIVTDGNTVTRYDHKIPDFATSEMNQETFYSCFGIRFDPLWQTWLVYTQNGQSNNSQVLIYNYMDQSWSIYRIPNNDSVSYDPTQGITCLGNWFNTASDPTFGNPNLGPGYPEDPAFKDAGNETFQSIYQQGSLILLAGDYQGNIWTTNSGGSDFAGNNPYPQDFTTGLPIEMNLWTRQWFPYAREGVASQFGYVDFLIDSDPLTVPVVSFYIENEGSPYQTTPFTCLPFENIILCFCTNITNANPAVFTSQDHGLETGNVVYVYGVQGMTEINGLFGTVTVINPNSFSLNINTTGFSTYNSGGYITSRPIDQSTFWTRVWSGQTGVFHQMNIVASGVDEPFTLHALIAYFKRSGRIYKGQR